MRTTLTLDDDIAERLMEKARETRQPFKAVVNAALRRGLGEQNSAVKPFRVKAHHGGLLPGIDPRKLNEFFWDLEQEDFFSRYNGKDSLR
jgi:hypothetical protein